VKIVRVPRARGVGRDRLRSDVEAAIAVIRGLHDNAAVVGDDEDAPSWVECHAWLCEKDAPEIIRLLTEGRIRAALGLAFTAGFSKGELTAFMRPGDRPIDVERPTMAKGLADSRKNRRDMEIWLRVLKATLADAGVHELSFWNRDLWGDGWKNKVATKGILVQRLKDAGVSRNLAARLIPRDWPTGKRGRPAKRK
jgi:hypothetical protein